MAEANRLGTGWGHDGFGFWQEGRGKNSPDPFFLFFEFGAGLQDSGGEALMILKSHAD
jgi:hypothetical protein